MPISIGSRESLQFAINETDTLAGTAQELISPVDGFITGLDVIIQKTVTTGGVVTVEINGVAVAGLSVTVPNSATKGSKFTDTATLGAASRAVKKFDRITVTPSAAFDVAGALAGNVYIDSSLMGEAAL